MNHDVKTHFTGKFPNGTVFDSSHERGAMMQVPVSHTLKGWQKALPLLKEGDVADVCLTPEWAFGEAGAPPHVSANQVVCYEIHLEQVLDGDQHHYIHPDYKEYAQQYQEMLEEYAKHGGEHASLATDL
uniref:peptidylprolyl isomerase n=1 Tax=Entomoneis paludosa TaxID=265537 RepID=A0A6U3B862_9STRA